MLVVEMMLSSSGNEELQGREGEGVSLRTKSSKGVPKKEKRHSPYLRAVGVGSAVGHAHNEWQVLQRRVKLVFEIPAPNTFTSGSIPQRVACLHDAVLDNAMED